MRSRRMLGSFLLTFACSGNGSPHLEGNTDTDPPGGHTDSSDELEPCAPTIESLERDIFSARCLGAGCHEAQSPAGGLDLESPSVATRLVGVASATCDGVLVIPAGADDSLLYAKMTNTQACGVQMPPDAPLAEAPVACVRAWIETLDQTCETCGGDVCIATANDAANCGGCGQACPSKAVCIAGSCTCSEALMLCGSACVNVKTSPDHCGGCNEACAESEVCNAGVCADGCDALVECNGGCVDTESDAEHCGACNASCGAGSSCIGGTCGCDASPKSYAADVEPIFVAQCSNMGCHRPPAPSANLDLTAGAGYEALVGVASEQCAQRLLVSPGKPGESYLQDKIVGHNLCSGTQMPKSSPLSASQIQTVSDWICTGAAP